jgi:hypothetical protein
VAVSAKEIVSRPVADAAQALHGQVPGAIARLGIVYLLGLQS